MYNNQNNALAEQKTFMLPAAIPEGEFTQEELAEDMDGLTPAENDNAPCAILTVELYRFSRVSTIKFMIKIIKVWRIFRDG